MLNSPYVSENCLNGDGYFSYSNYESGCKCCQDSGDSINGPNDRVDTDTWDLYQKECNFGNVCCVDGETNEIIHVPNEVPQNLVYTAKDYEPTDWRYNCSLLERILYDDCWNEAIKSIYGPSVLIILNAIIYSI